MSHRIFFTLLADHRSVGTKTKRHPSKLGLFPYNGKVRIIKEDGQKLSISIITLLFGFSSGAKESCYGFKKKIFKTSMKVSAPTRPTSNPPLFENIFLTSRNLLRFRNSFR